MTDMSTVEYGPLTKDKGLSAEGRRFVGAIKQDAGGDLKKAVEGIKSMGSIEDKEWQKVVKLAEKEYQKEEILDAGSGWRTVYDELRSKVWGNVKSDKFVENFVTPVLAKYKDDGENVTDVVEAVSGYLRDAKPEEVEQLKKKGVKGIVESALAQRHEQMTAQEKAAEVEAKEEMETLELKSVRLKIGEFADRAKYLVGASLVAIGAMWLFNRNMQDFSATAKASEASTRTPEPSVTAPAAAEAVNRVNGTPDTINWSMPVEATSIPTKQATPMATEIAVTKVVTPEFKAGKIDLTQPLNLYEVNGVRQVDVGRYVNSVIKVDSAEAYTKTQKALENPDALPGAQIVFATNDKGYFVSIHAGESTSGYRWPGEDLNSLTLQDEGKDWKSGSENLKLVTVFDVPKEIFAKSQRVYEEGSEDGKIKPRQPFIDIRYLVQVAGRTLPKGSNWFVIEECSGEWDPASNDYVKRRITIWMVEGSSNTHQAVTVRY